MAQERQLIEIPEYLSVRELAELMQTSPIDVMTDMANSRRRGFLAYQSTEDAFLELFASLRADKIIP